MQYLTPSNISSAAAAIPAVISGVSAAAHYGSKLIPGMKKVANTLFSSSGRRSAKEYLKGLTTVSGLQKAVTQDLPGAVKGVKGAIKGGMDLATHIGQTIPQTQGVTSQVNQALGQGLSTVKSVNKGLKGVKGAVTQGMAQTKNLNQPIVSQGKESYHDTLNKFVSDYGKHQTKKNLALIR